ncbi:hypothetical protein [Parashewanella tropica]|uniref:hypothetical protein n=1 Tax=Parashewanella tropica TaxID=2547970 RepID=UPI0010593668|nr:hypothetical protein [Parashewanella tropica]
MRIIGILLLATFTSVTYANEPLPNIHGKWLCPLDYEEDGVTFKGPSYDEYDLEKMVYSFSETVSIYIDSAEPIAQYKAQEKGKLQFKKGNLTFNLEQIKFKPVIDKEGILTKQFFDAVEKSYRETNPPIKTLSVKDNIWLSFDPKTQKSSECYKI